MSLTNVSLAGNNLIIPAQEEFARSVVIPSGDGKIGNLFYSVGSGKKIKKEMGG
jgi:hypothetical protein